jgi:RNA ligase
MSLHYEFPRIEHIDDIKDAIKDKTEFFIAERDWGYVCNYMVTLPTSFPPVESVNDAILRECRGIKFDKQGRIIARPYHKFFNIDERDGVRLHEVDFGKAHFIFDKLDGSMIHPLPIENGATFHLSTKMGITEVAQTAERFLDDNLNYVRFMRDMIDAGWTPLFEWCSRKNRIVIDYPNDRLILTGMRNNITGEYATGYDCYWLAHKYRLDFARYLHDDVKVLDIKSLIEHTRGLAGAEGYVVRFDDGHMFKIKAEDYLRQHRAKDTLSFEKNVIYLIVNNLVDDFLSALQEQDRQELEEFADTVTMSLQKTAEDLTRYINTSKKMSRKEFALSTPYNSFVKSLVFKFFETVGDVEVSAVYQAVCEFISKNSGTQKNIDSVRYLWGGTRWNERKIEDA